MKCYTSHEKPWTLSIRVSFALVLFSKCCIYNALTVIDSRKRRPKDAAVSAHPADAPSSSLFEESTTKKKSKVSKPGRLTLPQLHDLERKKEEEVKRGYKLLRELWPKMLLPQGAEGQEFAEREWLFEAEKLVDMFRETRNLFRASRVSDLTPVRPPMSERTLLPVV
jgi:general transcription factor 3C polypeptide 3 (transcription factor C subunit 4)